MDFAFTEEQEELRESARGFLAEFSGSEQVRHAAESELGYDPELWKQLGAELGWTSVVIPEEYGGLGLSYVELVALLEVMGSNLLCSPFFASICLGGNALLVGGSEEQKQEHLPGIAEGATRATLASTETGGRWDAAGIEAIARRDGGDFVLNGVKKFVVDGHCADLLIVAARSEGSSGEAGVSLFVVPGEAPGVERRALPTMDQTRRQAEITLRDVRIPANALMGEEGAGWAPLKKTLELAAVALSAEQVGGAQRCLDMAVEYAKEREQFGRPIGSFQAVKHRCADMLVDVEGMRSAVYHAAWALGAGDSEAPVAAATAKVWCSDAAVRVAESSLQVHGGIGFTWESDVHLYLKRAQLDSLLGGPTPKA